jgi:hypothetical protein
VVLGKAVVYIPICLFNILTEDIIYYTGGGSAHAPMVGGMSIPGLLFAHNLAIGSFVVNGLQKGTDKVVKYGGKGTQ